MSIVERLLSNCEDLVQKPGVRLDLQAATSLAANLEVAPLRTLVAEVFQSHKPARSYLTG